MSRLFLFDVVLPIDNYRLEKIDYLITESIALITVHSVLLRFRAILNIFVKYKWACLKHSKII